MALIKLVNVSSSEVEHNNEELQDVLDNGYAESVFVVASFAAAKLSAGKAGILRTTGHSTPGVGSATYVRTGSTGAPSSGNETLFYDASGAGWKLTGTSILPSVYGVVGTGLINETTKVQSWLDGCASIRACAWVPYGMSLGVGGLVLNENHNGLRFATEGEYKLFGVGGAAVNTPANLVGVGAYIGMYLNGCTGLIGNLRWNGDRASKGATEHNHCIGMFGGYNIELTLDFSECRGDGIYVNHYCGNSPTEITRPGIAQNFPTEIRFPSITSRNSEIDGRNALSLIAYKGVHVGTFMSYLHGDGGRVIGYQPGGLDVEPNQYWQSCYNLKVDFIDATASGSSGGFSLVGKINPSDPEDTNIRGVWVGGGRVVTQWYNTTGQHLGVPLASATDIDITLSSEGYTNPGAGNVMYGFNCSCLKQYRLNLKVKRVGLGIQIASENLAGAGVSTCTNGVVNIQSSHTHLVARTGGVTGLILNITGGTFLNLGLGDAGILEMRQTLINSVFTATTQRDAVYSVNLSGADSFLANLNYGIRNNVSNAVVPSRCLIDGTDLSGVPHNPDSNQNRVIGIAGFDKGRILGVTQKSGDDAIAGTSIWKAGDKRWYQESGLVAAGAVYNGTSWINF